MAKRRKSRKLSGSPAEHAKTGTAYYSIAEGNFLDVVEMVKTYGACAKAYTKLQNAHEELGRADANFTYTKSDLPRASDAHSAMTRADRIFYKACVTPVMSKKVKLSDLAGLRRRKSSRRK